MKSPSPAQQVVDQVVQRLQAHRRTPQATYRLQLHAEFTLRDALEIVPYLDDLGISHLYVSSLAAARPGSRHGYDVVDHRRLNPELGSLDDLTALADELHRRDMGLILDIVANHMHVGPDNAWWNDVLENGPSSPYADYFDIAWHDAQRERLRGKVLLPILDEPYGRALEGGKIRVCFEQGEACLLVNETRLPLDPRTLETVLGPALDAAKTEIGPEDPGVLELQSILAAAGHLPSRDDPDAERVRAGLAEIAVIKRRLRDLVQNAPALTPHVQAAVADLSGRSGDSGSFARLAALLEAQAYRPCYWRVALDEINYRRFFDVNDLAALATERPEVFQAIHALAFEWLAAGIVDGFRIDYIDGLRDPEEYLQRLQRYALTAIARGIHEASGSEIPWTELEPLVDEQLAALGAASPRVYVVVEKILGDHEPLPTTWLCDGTTGYDVLNEINGLFVDASQAAALNGVYVRCTGQTSSFGELVHDAKIRMMQSIMASELHMLAYRIDRLAQSHWYTQDFTLNTLRHALREIVACFSVYRSYVAQEAHPSDRVLVLRAAGQARRNNPLLGRPIIQFIADVLLLNDPIPDGVSDEYRQLQREIAGRFQQLTAPVTAKGVEDTVLYRFTRLVSLNEVGGHPARMGRSPLELHDFLTQRAATQPAAMTPLSTHDTKRSEDVRARINVLSECPDEWEQHISLWRALNARHLTTLEDGTAIPDANEEYLLYQTLVGSWPHGGPQANYVRRIQDYMTKAVREGKVHSSWINPDHAYDDAVGQFIERILDPSSSPEFLADLENFQQTIRWLGGWNSLSQTVLRCLCPGAPDTYQGMEFFDDSLVDPDNRRPVDYAARREALQQLQQESPTWPALQRDQFEPAAWNSLKLKIVNRCLHLRRELPDLFERGVYQPLNVTGPHAEHLFAFLHTESETAVLVVVPRLLFVLQPPTFAELTLDAAIELPSPWNQRQWRNIFTESIATLEPCHVENVLQAGPVGVWQAVV